jgi:hypothetical protein
MASFSSNLTNLTGFGLYYVKTSHDASKRFNQESTFMYRNQPRFPFEYYININLQGGGPAQKQYERYFNNVTWAQVQPLVKTIEMPSFKVETNSLNQYNRSRLSQTKLNFEPVRVVFHDVADGKTLKFWEMYYTYYFLDGIEPGVNQPKEPSRPGNASPYSLENLKNMVPTINPNLAGLPASVKDLFNPSKNGGGPGAPFNNNGIKSKLDNIVSNTMDNHLFGYNSYRIDNDRYLIKTIDIYQVHGGRFNKVTLVNPRITAFTHDVLNYAENGKTLEISFTFMYEYAYYTIQNLKLGEGGSSKIPFEGGEFLELPALSFNAQFQEFLESNNPLLTSDNPILNRIGKNTQAAIGAVTGAAASRVVSKVGSSALDGLANIHPTPYHNSSAAPVVARPFQSSAKPTSTAYKDVNRTK